MHNMDREVLGRSYEQVKTQAAQQWEQMLSRIEIETNDESMKRTFYSCLYRVLLFPHKFYEYNSKCCNCLKCGGNMYRLLIVDDEALFRKNLAQNVDWASYWIEICAQAENGIEALELVQTYAPEIIFCDIKTPMMDGIELLKRLTPKQRSCFVFISGYNDFAFTKQAVRYGVFDYLLKPLKEEELTGVVLRILEQLNTKDAFPMDGDLFLTSSIRRMGSLFTHLVEERNVNGIMRYIEDFFMQMQENELNLYPLAFREFQALAMKIEMEFKLPKMELEPPEDWDDRETIIKAVQKRFVAMVDCLLLQGSSEGRQIVAEVFRYIDEHYSDKISLGMISRKYFIIPSYFSQLFKSVTHDNFSTYLIKKRIEKAKEMLACQNIKVYQVSVKVGYEDEKHFSRIFKKYEGTSPTEYQQMHNISSHPV